MDTFLPQVEMSVEPHAHNLSCLVDRSAEIGISEQAWQFNFCWYF